MLTNFESLKYLCIKGIHSSSEVVTIKSDAEKLIEFKLIYEYHPFPYFDPKKLESIVALATGRTEVNFIYGDTKTKDKNILKKAPTDYNVCVSFINTSSSTKQKIKSISLRTEAFFL